MVEKQARTHVHSSLPPGSTSAPTTSNTADCPVLHSTQIRRRVVLGDAGHRRHPLGRVRLPEDLPRNLSEVVDEADHSTASHGVVDRVDVHVPLVEQVVEHVGGGNGGFTTLLVAENQVDPVVQVRRDVFALQRLQKNAKVLA